MKKKYKKNFLWGALFGAIAPFIGLFIGLQIMPFLGTILTFPAILIDQIVNQPFGNFSTGLLALSFIFSAVIWGGIFVILSRLKDAIS